MRTTSRLHPRLQVFDRAQKEMRACGSLTDTTTRRCTWSLPRTLRNGTANVVGAATAACGAFGDGLGLAGPGLLLHIRQEDCTAGRVHMLCLGLGTGGRIGEARAGTAGPIQCCWARLGAADHHRALPGS